MSPERWKKVEAIFNAALAFETDEREDFVRRACADDPEMVEQVRSMLANDENSESFFGAGVFGLLESETDDPLAADENVDRRIGAYRLVRPLGRGGMGAVYLAERADEEYRHQAAVKLIKRGMDTDLVLRRFRHERQILADLDHPHIARLLDGGTTTDGLPYFVMEYIDGQSILEYCNERRLSIEERLRLFLQVCSAVEYAHQKTIIHRDIKPGNILVTDEGNAKLLDFGIAKILDDDRAEETFETSPALRLLTPEYASPEHLRGLPVTEVSDIYSLGILLYELLTDHHPYRSGLAGQSSPETGKSGNAERPSEVIFVAGEENSGRDSKRNLSPELISARRRTTPQALHEELKGNLDAIILQAISESPGLRPQSANRLARQIESHLTGIDLTSDRSSLPVGETKMELKEIPGERHLEENKGAFGGQKSLSPRQKGIRQAAVLIMSGVIGTPLVVFLSLELKLKPTWTLIFAVLTILGGLMRLGYAVIFEESWTPAILSDNLPKSSIHDREKEMPVLDSRSVPPGSWMDEVDDRNIIQSKKNSR
jgi:serine/threonine protein kinase